MGICQASQNEARIQILAQMEPLRFFFLNATFESSLIRVFFLNFCWSLIPPTQWKNDLKPTKLQRHLSMQTLFWMMTTMYNNQTRTLYEIDLVFVITREKRKLFTLLSSVSSSFIGYSSLVKGNHTAFKANFASFQSFSSIVRIYMHFNTHLIPFSSDYLNCSGTITFGQIFKVWNYRLLL